MFNELLEIFETMIKCKGENFLYDNYIPKQGTYILLNFEDNFSVRNIFDIGKPDKKDGTIPGMTNKDYKFVCFLDKNSKLITMNKSVDTSKIIHSNNFYSFFVKKESFETGKLSGKSIEGYYDILLNPYLKYKKKNANEIYSEVEKKLGVVENEIVNKIKNWIQSSLKYFIEENKVKLSLDKKEYLKIFFVYSDDEKTKNVIEKEGERYFLPNIFNNNDYNVKVNDEIYGLHNNNMGLNDKKPFLDNKTRKESIPCAITMKQAMLQYKFMEYLSSQAAKNNYNVYIDLDNKNIQCIKDNDVMGNIESGLYFRIRQGKNEVEINSLERIVQYNINLKDAFFMKEVFALTEKEQEKYSAFYGAKYKLNDIEMLVNESLFSSWLIGNYKTSPNEMPDKIDSIIKEELMLCRDQLWKWFHNCESQNVEIVLNKTCRHIIRNNIENGYYGKAKHQFNLWFSLVDYLNKNRRNEERMSSVREQLKKHINMEEDWDFESDDEYYYAVGQISRYILDLSKASKKTLDMLMPILTVRNDKNLKERVELLAKKYAYAIEMKYKRTCILLARVLTYEPNKKADDTLIMAGYTDNNILYSARKEEDKEINKENDINN